jgi:hypothetical protein
MNAHFNLISGDQFRTSDNRTFKILNVWWRGGKQSDIDFIQVFDEPEPTEVISKSYYIIEELVINKKIILI